MHILFLNEKLKRGNLTILISQRMQGKNLCCIWFGRRTRFNMFQILTTKRKGMVVANPAPRASPGILRQSCANPGSARLLTVTGTSPEGLGVLALLWPFWSALKSTEEEQQTTEILSTRDNADKVVMKLFYYYTNIWLCDLSTVGHDCT